MNKILNNPDEYRGYFISQFAELERSIDMFLADYFIPDDSNCAEELIEILIDRITFESKRTALRVIFERQPETDIIRNKKVIPKGVYKKLLEEIRKSSVIRNYFAHYKTIDFDKSDAYYPIIKDKNVIIGLVQFRDSTTHITYTNAKFYEEIEKIGKCKDAILKMLSE